MCAALAEACRTGDLSPRAPRVGRAARQRRRELRVREQLVRTRTQLINLVRAQLRQEGHRLPGGASRDGRRGAMRRWRCPTALRTALAPVVALLDDARRPSCGRADAAAAATAAAADAGGAAVDDGPGRRARSPR